MTPGAPMRFGPFALGDGGLSRHGKPVALGQRALALLTALVEAEGAVGKQALMEAGWPGSTVEEGNLSVQIAALRKALGARDDGGEWIVTVPRVGYRLVRGEASAPVAADLDLGPPRLAVLPFLNLDRDPEHDKIAAGIVDELINALSRFKSFEVVSRRDALAYGGRLSNVREVATELDARYLLEGAVRRAGDTLRITTELVDAETGTLVWSDRLDGPAGDVFALQDEVTCRVAGAGVSALQVAEVERAAHVQVARPSAYLLYMRALSKASLGSREHNAEACALIQQALELDPRNGSAYGYGAMILSNRLRMGWPGFSPDDRALCARYAEAGVHNARGDARAMAECADAMLHGTREYRRSLELVRQARETNPFDMRAARACGVANIHCGDLDEALECLHRAFRLSPRDPLAPVSLTGIAHVCMIRGDYEEAIQWAAKSLGISAGFDATYWMLIAGHAHLGHVEEARRYLVELLKRAPHETLATIEAGQPDFDRGRIASIIEGLRLAGMPER